MREAQVLISLDQQLAQDQGLQIIYGLKNRYAALSRALDLMGLPIDQLLTDPESPEAQQTMAAMQSQSQEQAAMQKALIAAQIQAAQAQAEVYRSRALLDMMKQVHEARLDEDKLDLETDKFEWDQVVDLAELRLERDQQRPVSLRK